MDSDNITKQTEEIEALSSIYGDDWITESEHSYTIKILENKIEATLYITLPPEYPANSPPKYELSAPLMDRKCKENLHTALDEVYLENIGETVIFQWVEKIRETLQTLKHHGSQQKKHVAKNAQPDADISELVISSPDITHGEVIVDRKSSFQGHAAVVHSLDEVNAVLSKLKQNKKVLNATHNMYAYRIERKTEKGVAMLQDCDDDGETHAGGRMLHLLQILDQRNAVVVVSRWYGGIQLGPDRFRHINNAARLVLTQAGLIKK